MLDAKADRVGVLTAALVVVAWQTLPFTLAAVQWVRCTLVEKCPPVFCDFDCDWRILAFRSPDRVEVVEMAVLATVGFVLGAAFTGRTKTK